VVSADNELPPELATAVLDVLHWYEEVAARGAGVEELTALIEEWQRILAAFTAGSPDHAEVLSYLGVSQYLRFRAGGRPEDLDQAIATSRSALVGEPPEDLRVVVLATLSGMLVVQFETTGRQADLDQAVAVGRQAAEEMPAEDPRLPGTFSNLCMALRVRFRQTGDLGDLDAAVDYGRRAVQGEPGNLDLFNNLSAALRTRFTRKGDRADLDEAVGFAESAGLAPEGHPNRLHFLNTLASALFARYQELGELPDLLRAIETFRTALTVCPPDNPEPGALLLSQLGAALRHKFEQVGDLAELDEAITAEQSAVALTGRHHPARHQRVFNLASALKLRFDHTGSAADLAQALNWARESAAGLGIGHPDRPHALHLLAVVLSASFKRSRRPAELDDAIEAAREAVATTPEDQPLRVEHLTVLGTVLDDRAAVTGARTDLDESVEVGRQAIRAATEGTPMWAVVVSNHALTLRRRFELSGAPDDLRQVIVAQRMVLSATPGDSAEYGPRLMNLANSLLTSSTGPAAHEVTGLFLEAAYHPAIAPSIRIDAAMAAATTLVTTDGARAAQLLELAVRLLPERASYRLDRADRQHILGGVAGLTSHAASLASYHDTGTAESPALHAVRLLELGRGVMLSQTLDSRGDLTELQARQPELAARFLALRDQLDGLVPTDDRHRSSVEFAALLAEVRRLEDFETFLLPPEPAVLLEQAEAGPIVVLNVSKYASDALLVTVDGVTVLPLPDVAFEPARERVVAFLEALELAHDPVADARRRIGAQTTLDEILGWLWDAAVGPVLDQLGYRSTPAEGEPWPRVWWIPVGMMAMLPVHAAGHHRRSSTPVGRPTAMDRVVSSYTPTLRALEFARQRDSAVAVTAPALVVAMPTTPGLDQPLHHAAREAELVAAHLPGATLLLEAADSAVPPTKSAVLARLSGSAIAHFACHGTDQPDDPSRSRLLLRDHETDPLTVGDLAPIRLDRARLAYLSACRTALSTATQLVDEAIHLSTAFLLAGYPHVVGTLWEIDDALAVSIADDFYAVLITGETIDTSRTAHALHSAVRTARDRLPRTPSLWAGHIHTGA
jgi:tetratricopeptide (TPR) repeat protein